MNKSVNAVVLNYNQQEATRRVADELRRSRGVDIDVLVVDAPSEVGDRAVLQLHIPPGRLLLLERNLGYAGGMNAGIAFWQKLAPETPVLLVTPDCRVPDEVVLGLRQALDSDPDVGAAGPVIIYREAPNERIGAGGYFEPARARIAMYPEIKSNTPYDVDWIEGCCMMLRPQAIRDVGGLDEAYFLYWEETDLCERLRRAGWRVRLAPTVHVRHPKSAGSAPPHYYYYMNRNAYRFWAKNFGLPMRATAAEELRATFRLASVAIGAVVLPKRWPEVPDRWRNLRLQLRGLWSGTRDYLRGKSGPQTP